MSKKILFGALVALFAGNKQDDALWINASNHSNRNSLIVNWLPTREIIRRSLDLGVNFFDTVIAYQLGTSEQFVGRVLKDMARREDVVVATKFLPRTEEEITNGTREIYIGSAPVRIVSAV